MSRVLLGYVRPVRRVIGVAPLRASELEPDPARGHENVKSNQPTKDNEEKDHTCLTAAARARTQ